MKIPVYFILICGLTACGGQLSEKQRKELQNESKLHEIKRVTDDEIMLKAMETGRKVRAELNKGRDKAAIEQEYNVSIHRYLKEEPQMEEKVRALWRAYKTSEHSLDPATDDNLQRDYPEHLIYTYPVIQDDTLAAMEVILLSKKAVIIDI